VLCLRTAAPAVAGAAELVEAAELAAGHKWPKYVYKTAM